MPHSAAVLASGKRVNKRERPTRPVNLRGAGTMSGLRIASRALSRAVRATPQPSAAAPMPVRAFAAAAAAEQDIVAKVFTDQQNKFRALMEKSKALSPPLDGDEAKIIAYMEQRQKIMSQVRARVFLLRNSRSGRTGRASLGGERRLA